MSKSSNQCSMNNETYKVSQSMFNEQCYRDSQRINKAQEMSRFIKRRERIKKVRNRTTHQVDAIADRLVEKFQAPQCRPFFCKCAWYLSEDTIWTIYELSNKPSVVCPVKYFVAACNSKF